MGKAYVPTNPRAEGKGSPSQSKHSPQEMIAHAKPQDPEYEEDSSEEEEGEIGTPQVSQKKDRRGRKIDKERREESTYRDTLLGAQITIKGMMNPIPTRPKGQASKVAAHLPKGK